MHADPTAGSHGLHRPLLVWTIGLLAYIAAVAGRSAFGVASVEATDRFGVEGAVLSLFGVVQLGSYAAAQIPAGLLLDRIGPRRMLILGALIMAAGHTLLAFGTELPIALLARTLTGVGDACTLISAVRLTASWFPNNRVPLFTQLTSTLGQAGQAIAAAPFFALLLSAGWSIAFSSLTLMLLVVVVLVLALVRDRPSDDTDHRPRVRIGAWQGLCEVIRSRAAWAGLFSHWLVFFSVNAFLQLWGVPYLTFGHALTTSEVSFLLTLSVVATMVTGPIIGILTGRMPQHRIGLVCCTTTVIFLVWALTLAAPQQLTPGQLAPLMIVLGLGTGMLSVGFDLARTGVRPELIGTATGFVNIGGFGAGLLAVLLIGVVLDLLTDGAAADLEEYRIALASQGVLFIAGSIGLALTLRLPKKSDPWD